MNIRSRWEDIMDIDYVDKLSEKDKKYLNDFMGEYVNASIPKDEKRRIHKKKTDIKKIYDKNNARNRCVYSKGKAQGNLMYVEDMKTALKEQPDSIEHNALAKLFHPVEKLNSRKKKSS